MDSASTTRNRMRTRCGYKSRPQCTFVIKKFKEESKHVLISRRVKQTSYEMHVAILRVPPNVEYLELEPQPAASRA